MKWIARFYFSGEEALDSLGGSTAKLTLELTLDVANDVRKGESISNIITKKYVSKPSVFIYSLEIKPIWESLVYLLNECTY